jgi:aspartate-semialdehyde dehydrogenase
MTTKYSIAIVGATGLSGATLLSLFEEKSFPFAELYLIASQQSAGKSLSFLGKKYCIHDLATFDFQQVSLSFFCVSSDLAKEYIPKATRAGGIVIDKSYYFRNHDDVPLIVPEVNVDTLGHYQKMNIIANPNCSTIPITVALKPIYDAVGITRINISTYQSVSGTGKEAVQELTDQTQQLLAKQPVKMSVYPQQIAFNVLPHIDDFQENGYTREEMKMVWEIQKIFNDKSITINPTAVRVPVYYGHAASLHLETRDKITIEQALVLLANAPGVSLITGQYPYPTPAKDAAGRDPVYVGRVREDISHPRGLNMWVVADNLRKGSALNAIQIAEHLMRDHQLPC